MGKPNRLTTLLVGSEKVRVRKEACLFFVCTLLIASSLVSCTPLSFAWRSFNKACLSSSASVPFFILRMGESPPLGDLDSLDESRERIGANPSRLPSVRTVVGPEVVYLHHPLLLLLSSRTATLHLLLLSVSFATELPHCDSTSSAAVCIFCY